MKKRNIVFLYSEIAGYFLACCAKLAQLCNINVYIIRWPVNKEAPFDFTIPEGVQCFEKSDFDGAKLTDFIKSLEPDLIYCSGWMDKDYLKVVAHFKNKIPLVVGFDNHWRGTFKQQLASLFARFTVLKNFTHAWIPGKPQFEFAKRLGFKNERILQGYYCADTDSYSKAYADSLEIKKDKFPHRFIYVGRYYDFKGVKDLWEAFVKFKSATQNDWELWCFGTGDVKPLSHPSIKHFGFVQPDKLLNYLKEVGVFVLPSRFEPWGVVVHEFAAAGFPLICSDEVGAGASFLNVGVNGFLFKAGNVESLNMKFQEVAKLSDDELLKMANESHKLSKNITTDTWAKTIYSVVDRGE